MKTMTDFIFLGSKITADWDCSHEIKRHLLFGRKAMTNWKARQCIQKQRHHFAYKDLYSQSYGFSCSHISMWELDHKEGWALKNWCFRTVVLETTLESLFDSKEIKPVNSKGHQPWIFIGRTDAEDDVPILRPTDMKSQLIGKDCDSGKEWEQEEKGRQRIRWLDGIMDSMDMNLSKLYEITGSLECCSPWDCRVGHDWTTEQQNSTQWETNWRILRQGVALRLLSEHI